MRWSCWTTRPSTALQWNACTWRTPPSRRSTASCPPSWRPAQPRCGTRVRRGAGRGGGGAAMAGRQGGPAAGTRPGRGLPVEGCGGLPAQHADTPALCQLLPGTSLPRLSRRRPQPAALAAAAGPGLNAQCVRWAGREAPRQRASWLPASALPCPALPALALRPTASTCCAFHGPAGYMNNDLVGLIASLIPTPRCHFLQVGAAAAAAAVAAAATAAITGLHAMPLDRRMTR